MWHSKDGFGKNGTAWWNEDLGNLIDEKDRGGKEKLNLSENSDD